MKKFVINLLIFAILFLAFDKLFIIVANLSANAEIDKRLEYLMNGMINNDVIIVGSSTGSRDIIASQIEDKTGLTSYNLCYPGSNVEFHEFIVRTLLKFDRMPRLLLLVVDDDKELLFDETTTFRKDRMYPLVKYRFVRQELVSRGEKDKFFSKFLVLHQLNKANFDIRKKQFTPLDTVYSCGSMPISWRREGREWNYISDEQPYNQEDELPEKVLAFEKIIETCKSNNINVIIIFPPVFKKHSISFEERIRQLGGPGNNYYLYNTNNPIYKDKDYYYDETHLIRKSAVVFTDEIIMYLNTLTTEVVQ